MKEKVRLKGRLRGYAQWPLLLSMLLLAMNICMYPISVKAGLLVSGFLVVYVFIVMTLYLRSRTQIYNELIEFATQYGQVQRKLLKELALPYALLDEEGRVLWGNTAFFEASKKTKKALHKSISWFFPEFTKEQFLQENDKDEKSVRFSFEERDFRVDIRRVYMEHVMENNALMDMGDDAGCLIAIYMFDETEINKYIRMNKEERLVAGLIYLDNYEEALDTVEEVRRSLLVALVDRKINKYIGAFGGIVKKMEKDKYFIAIQEKHLPIMRENKFELLQDVKTVNIGNEMAVTLSIGLGLSGGSFAENYDYARIAIDLALARGGDQVVTKEGESITYFGGKTQQVEKATRVKARVKAHALREFIESRDRVMVMGHKMGDMDSFGASIGIYRAAKVLGKRAYIVINDITNSVRPLRESFNDNPTYETDMFLTGEQALEMIDRNTVLVVVDTNRPNYTECSGLLSRASTIVVLDHHRQTNEQIENAVLSYIEPYASSACEMVAEILQYFDEGLKIKTAEADCLYAGIVLDTDNFMRRTGVRTFEAAAFLRRCGADVTRVRKMFRNEMVEYKARAEAVRHAEVYHGFAISICPTENIESPTIVGAQAADELLNIVGVRASIVLTYYQQKTFVSARSIDEVNVQILMERMGGGGHMNMAGAQLVCEVEEAMEIVKHTIEKMQEEGEFE
ncbi:MAG: DHH family phosphoesterase [Lachnospiraceae bacterium]|jgi:c-di-AMP phosphodiesterase-like protein|nr:DHH family phosphoesterase [Lachnospiraceae bacterium]